jgi:hypothetical protein
MGTSCGTEKVSEGVCNQSPTSLANSIGKNVQISHMTLQREFFSL